MRNRGHCSAAPGEVDHAGVIAFVGDSPLIAGYVYGELKTATLIRLGNDRIFTDDFAR